MNGTKEKILDAAEGLFAEHGFGETSLRQITTQAGVNLAAINYHFRSKDALIQAVFTRRIDPLNQKRLAMLDACEAENSNGPLPLVPVIRALVGPMLELQKELGERGHDFKRLMGRMYVEPGDTVRKILFEQMQTIADRFIAAFQRALPHLPTVELLWRIHFCIGVLSHTLAGTSHLEVVSKGLCDPSDAEATTERIVAFLVAGMRAPLPAMPTRS
jgi:AcrR family transcriptional regulator